MRINKAVFRYIEFELYNYEQTKRDLELERERILESSPCQEVAVQSDIGDSTANKAIKLTSSAFILKAEKIVNAINKSLDILGDSHNKLFDLRYIDGRPEKEVYLVMNISRGHYFKVRRELVETVGLQLGLLRFK
jgi:DNA-directed RNA polymerase specialized sigma subunit